MIKCNSFLLKCRPDVDKDLARARMQHLVRFVVKLDHHFIPALDSRFLAVHEIERSHVPDVAFRIKIFHLLNQLLRGTWFLDSKVECGRHGDDCVCGSLTIRRLICEEV